MGESRVVLLTTAGCHLCVEARVALDRVSRRTGVSWSEVDVAADEALRREYADRLPVVLLDGREHGYWRVEEDRLVADISR
ncbi:glutaredoxin family protein [Phytomonospora sp. NPDC050363]|uniref:glutaredoxin family protein n=1 Tax=Phytomonospora sp. NPDC050363 TaxID=3155642 RepID=UPI0033C79E77